MGTDSFPLPPYEDVPGWYVPVLLSAGTVAEENFAPALAEQANARLFVHPADNAWLLLPRGRAAVLLFPEREIDVRILAADSLRPVRSGADFASPLDVELRDLDHSWATLGELWLLPRRIPGAAQLAAHKVVQGDTMVVWSADNVALVLKRINRSSARIYARTPSGNLIPIRTIEHDPKADREMGVEPDSIFEFNHDDPWMPSVGAVFRFGPAGPWVFVLHTQGYECVNQNLVRIDLRTAKTVSEGRQYSQCTV